MGDSDEKPACKYGLKCYRQNQAHKDQYSHPPKDRPKNDAEIVDRRSKSPQPPAKKRKPSSPESDSDADDDKRSGRDNKGENASDDENEDRKSAQSDKDEDSKSEKDDDTTAEVESNSNGASSKNNTASKKLADDQSSTSTEAVGVRCSEFINENFDKGPHAQRAEHKKLLDSPADFISAKFLVKMPDDFYTFWEFCKAESKAKSNPETLFEKFGLNLVGPFDVLAKKFDNIDPFEPGDYLRHWRFYYDPPEFQVRLLLVQQLFLSFHHLLMIFALRTSFFGLILNENIFQIDSIALSLDSVGEGKIWRSLWLLAR